MREKISEMEAKTLVFRRESDSYKVSANIHSHLFSFFFKGSQKGGRQVGEVTKEFPMRRSAGTK